MSVHITTHEQEYAQTVKRSVGCVLCAASKGSKTLSPCKSVHGTYLVVSAMLVLQHAAGVPVKQAGLARQEEQDQNAVILEVHFLT